MCVGRSSSKSSNFNSLLGLCLRSLMDTCRLQGREKRYTLLSTLCLYNEEGNLRRRSSNICFVWRLYGADGGCATFEISGESAMAER